MPLGVHPATLDELSRVFGKSCPERELLLQRIRRIYELARSTGFLARFIVYGSFVSDKLIPNDVDVFMVFDDAFDATNSTEEVAILLDHAMADAHFGASVFWLRRPAAFGGEQAIIDFWQTKRDGTQRGIVEIVEKA